MRVLRKSVIAGAALAAAFAWTSAASAQTSLLEVERRFPECAGMFTQAHVDELARAGQDPEEGFKQWARRRVTLIEVPPPVACKSKIWRYLHGAGATAERAAAVGALLRDPISVIFRFSTLVGPSHPIEVEEAQSETTVAVNPNSPLQLVGGANTYYYDPAPECQSPAGATYGTQALYGSFDSGTTWIYRCAPWHPGVTGGVPGADYWFGSDPAVAWDAEGRVYAAYMLISGDFGDDTNTGSAIVIARSTNGGSSWEPWSVVANSITDPAKYHDKEMIAVDTSNGGPSSHPGRVYVIWGQNNTERVAWSDDGVEWHLTPFGMVGKFHIGGNIAVGPDGVVYAVWNRVFLSDSPDEAPPGDETWFTKSIDGGESWSTPVKILKHKRGSFDESNPPRAQESRWVNSFLSIDVQRNPESPYYGRVHLAWADMTPSAPGKPGPIDVYSTWSKEGGDTWEKPLRVNDDDGAAHIFPWLAVDQSDGAVHIAWYDTRDDPGLGEETRVYTARSIDGGVSFEANLNINGKGDLFANDVTFSNENLTTNPNARLDQYGDYMGLAAANRQVFALTTDSRSFFPDFTALREDAALVNATYCSRPRWHVGVAPKVPDSTIGSIDVFLPQPVSWGINATGGTVHVLRYSGAGCQGSPVRIEVSSGTLLLLDTPPATGMYSYQIRVRNNCPGTALTPMTGVTACSAPVSFLLL